MLRTIASVGQVGLANLNLTEFKGLDTVHTSSAIDDTAQAELVNMVLTERGYLQKRTGLHRNTAINDGDGLTFLGRFHTSTFDRIITLNGQDDDLDYFPLPLDITDSTFTQINNNVSAGVCHGAQYSTKFYITSFAGDSYVYDGTTLTAFASKVAGTQNFFHLDREWIINCVSGTQWDDLRYSEIAGSGGTDFSTANHPSANVIKVGPGDGSACTKIIKFNDNLYIFKRDSVWVLFTETNTPSDWTLRQIEPGLGCTSGRGAEVHENLLYFLSMDGVYRTDGTTFEEISAPIRDFWAGRGLPLNLYDLNFYESLAIVGDLLFVFVYNPDESSDDRHQTFVYNIRTKGWSRFIWRNLVSGGTIFRTPIVVSDYGLPLMYLGEFNATNGYIYWWGQNDRWTDASEDAVFSFATPYESYLVTKFFDFQEPGTWKRMTDATIDYYIREDPLKWKWYYEDGTESSEWSVEAIGSGLDTIETNRGLDQLPPAEHFRSIKARLSDNAGNQDWVLYGLTFSVTERRIAGQKIDVNG